MVTSAFVCTPDVASLVCGGEFIMYAIIETGGKQYRVRKDDVFNVEKLDANVGDKVVFDKVYAVNDGEIRIGTPFVKGYKVVAEVLEQGKDKKIIIFKYKAKKDYRKKNGHRQPYTKIKILEIGDGAASESATTEEVPVNKETAASVDAKVRVSMSMKKDELLSIAKEANIKVSSKDTKQEIIDAINGTN